MVINEGKFYICGEIFLFEFVRDFFCDDWILCFGMLENLNELGYKLENIRIMVVWICEKCLCKIM